MPILHSVIPETETHIILPVGKQVAHYLVNSLGLSKQIKDNIFVDTGWTTTKGTRDNHRFRIRSNSLQMKVSLRPIGNQKWEYHNDTFNTGFHGQSILNIAANYPKVVEDPDANLTMYEMFLPCTLDCECKFWFVDRNLAYELLDKLQHRYTSNTVTTLHINYDYPLSKDMLSMLYNLYLFRDIKYKDVDKKISFNEYFNMIARQKFDVVKARAANHKEIVIEKNIINALLSFEHENDKPQENKQRKSTEYYEISLNTSIQFQRASELVLHYPIIIDNQLLPERLIPIPRNNDQPIQSIADATHPLPYFELLHRKIHRKMYEPIRFPFYDTDWLPPYDHLRKHSYFPFFISAYLLDLDEEYTKIPLLDLQDDYKLHPVVLDVIKEQGYETFHPDAIFNISLYMDDYIEARDKYFINENLEVCIKAKDIHPVRRIIISEISDKKQMNPKWWYLIKKHEWFFGIKQLYWRDDYVAHQALRIFRNTLIPRDPETRNRIYYTSK